jgi:hypothetical protein
MRELAADEFGDFERTHPDAAHAVNVDDFFERLFLLRRPRRRKRRRRRGGDARQIGMAVAAQFFNRLREREIFADGALDDFHQFRERKFKRNRGKLGVGLLRDRIGRRHRAAGNGDAHPFAERGIVAEFGDVGISRALDVREPVARFGMDVDFVKPDDLQSCARKCGAQDGRRKIARSASTAARASNPSARKASAGRAR